jgi:predicted RNA binding protein with dsRBD fold (UPF0201 family)
MVREQSVTVDKVELTLTRVRKTPTKLLYILRSIQAEQAIEPLLNRVVLAIPDRLIQFYLKKSSARINEVSFLDMLDSHLILLPQAVNELQRQAATCSLIAMDSR